MRTNADANSDSDSDFTTKGTCHSIASTIPTAMGIARAPTVLVSEHLTVSG